MNKALRFKLVATTAAFILALGAGSVYAAASGADPTSNGQNAQPNDSTSASTGGRAEKHGMHDGDKAGMGKKHAMMRMGTHPGTLYEQAAKTLNMDKEALMQELRGGKSLSDVAKAKNVKETDLKAALLKDQSARLDQAVQNGKLTADKAQAIKDKMGAFLDELIQRKGMMFSHKRQMMPSLDKLATRLGLSEKDLGEKLKSGKSLSEIAQEKGVSKEQLINGIKEDLTPEIEKMIEHKTGPSKAEKSEKAK